MLKDKTSVIFVDKKANGSRLLLVPTFLLLHWRNFILTFFTLLAVLLCLGGIFIYQNVDNNYKEKLAEANFVRRNVNLEKLKSSFKSIDSSMSRINFFMKERGISNFKIKNAGGEESFEISDINEVTNFYKINIKELEEALQNVPMGRPHEGEITSIFGVRHNPFTGEGAESHSGIDFRGVVGEPVKTTAKGKIVFAGVKGGYGNCIIIDHDYQLSTLYGHLNKILVKEDDWVNLGQQIGELGNTGRSTGPHLHYEIHFKGERINPDLYMNFK